MNRLYPSRHSYRHATAPFQRETGLSRCRALSTSTYYTVNPRHQQPHLPFKTSPKISHQKRTFLSSFLPSTPPQPNNGGANGGGNNSNARILTASRTLPYAPPPLYKTISSVESYADFLPFLTTSTVTARDQETGYPTQATLTVGYGPLSETFTSKVECDLGNWIVEAKSGERFTPTEAAGAGKKDQSGLGALASLAGIGFPGADEGIFEYLRTKWELVPQSGSEGQTTVNLEIRFEFKNAMYAKMMGAVEGQMAGIMIEAFERRVREVHGR
ncbi:hypothetical protein BJX99DRAFT_225200 [Aspergillus californicus]